MIRMLGAAALLLAFAADGLADQPSIRIGVGAPFSGPDAIYGNAIRLGVDQAVADLGIGFAGRRAIVLARDDGNDPKRGVDIAHAFVAEHIGIVVGHFSSAVTVPAAAVYAEAGVIDITPTAAAPLVTDRGFATVFRTCGRADEDAAAAARFVAARRILRVAVIHDRGSTGKEFADGVRRRLGEIGLRDIYYGSFEKGAHDVGGLVARIKAANSQMVVFGGGAAEAGLLAKQLRDAGLRLPLLGGAAMASDEFAAVAGSAAEGAMAAFPDDPRTRNSAADLLRRLKARGVDPDFAVFYAYAAVQVLAQAASAAGTIEPERLAAAMHDGRTFTTVLGDVVFDAKGDPGLADRTIYVWHRGASGRMAIDEQARS